MSQSNQVPFARVAAFLILAAVLSPASRSAEGGTLQVWDCENLSRVVVRLSPEAAELRLPNRVVTLPRIAGAEERYSQGDVTFWNGRTYARIEESGSSDICRSNPTEVAWEDARLRGIEIRAA